MVLVLLFGFGMMRLLENELFRYTGIFIWLPSFMKRMEQKIKKVGRRVILFLFYYFTLLVENEY